MLLTRVEYYAVLAIDKTVGESEIKKAYFKMSKEYHPDRHANAEDEMKEEFSTKFKLAKEAYEVLSDMEKRKIYDIGQNNATHHNAHQCSSFLRTAPNAEQIVKARKYHTTD